MATSFDELWEDQDGHRRDASPGKRSRSQNDPRSSWAAVGLVRAFVWLQESVFPAVLFWLFCFVTCLFV